MKLMSVGELKANFSRVLKHVLAGEEIGILYGKKKEMVAKLVPKNAGKKPRRKIGILEPRGKIKTGKHFKITENEFLNAYTLIGSDSIIKKHKPEGLKVFFI